MMAATVVASSVLRAVVVVPDMCEGLDGGFWWWYYGCFFPYGAAGALWSAGLAVLAAGLSGFVVSSRRGRGVEVAS